MRLPHRRDWLLAQQRHNGPWQLSTMIVFMQVEKPLVKLRTCQLNEAKRRKGSKAHATMQTLGLVLALVTPANHEYSEPLGPGLQQPQHPGLVGIGLYLFAAS